jgi:hypothetical protein
MNDIESQNIPSSKKEFHLMEWILSIIAALNCAIVVGVFASLNSPDFLTTFSSLWPFPMIYFIEIITIGIIGLVAVGNLKTQEKSNWSASFWICSGIILAFVILGAWTIGFFILPAMVIYLVLGILTDKRTENDIPLHLVFFVAAGISQAIFVFLTLFG